MRYKGAFTVMELLVVISILVVLFALLIPVLIQVRQVARQTICTSNLRQQVVIAATYSNNYKTVFPLGWVENFQQFNYGLWTNGNSNTRVPAPILFGRTVVAQIVNDPGVFFCPSQEAYTGYTQKTSIGIFTDASGIPTSTLPLKSLPYTSFTPSRVMNNMSVRPTVNFTRQNNIYLPAVGSRWPSLANYSSSTNAVFADLITGILNHPGNSSTYNVNTGLNGAYNTSLAGFNVAYGDGSSHFVKLAVMNSDFQNLVSNFTFLQTNNSIIANAWLTLDKN